MFRRACILSALLAGCGSFSESGDAPGTDGGDGGEAGLAPQPEAGSDGASADGMTDAGPRPCVPRAASKPFFVAAFDDDSGAGHYYVQGGPVTSPPPPAGTMVTYTAPATTLPFAMLIAATSSPFMPYVLDTKADVNGGVCSLHAELDVEFKSPPLGAMDGTLLAELGVRDDTPGGFDHCYVTLDYASSPAGLVLQSHCGSPDVYRYKVAVAGLPPSDGYHHFKLDVSLAEGRAQIVYGAAEPVILMLDAPQVVRGGATAHAAFGMGAPKTGSLEGMQLRFDSITVDTR